MPASFLRRVVNKKAREHEACREELERRGTPIAHVDISNHAIDRVSLRFWKVWRKERTTDEGIHSWLCRMCIEAAARHEPDAQGRLKYKGMVLIFATDGEWPVLVTVAKG